MPRSDGYDVSEYQPNTDWAKVADMHPDLVFVCCKATQGASYVDPQFRGNQARLRDQVAKGWSAKRTVLEPVVLVWYHFHHQGTAQAQANHFRSTVGPIRDGETVMLNTENNEALGIPVYSVDAQLQLLDAIDAAFGRATLHYIGFYYPGSGDARFASRPLWLPAYTSGPPRTHRPWLIWQWGTPTGGLGNPGQQVDTNEVSDPAQLRALAHITAPLPPEEPDVTREELQTELMNQDTRMRAYIDAKVVAEIDRVLDQLDPRRNDHDPVKPIRDLVEDLVNRP